MAFREAAGPPVLGVQRARPGPVCSRRKPSGRGKKARVDAATMLTTTAAAADPAPTKMTAIARATATTAAAVRTAVRARAALEGRRRHEIDSRVLKVAKSNSMSSAANGGGGGGGGAEAAGKGHNRDLDKEGSTVQSLGNIITCINCRR